MWTWNFSFTSASISGDKSCHFPNVIIMAWSFSVALFHWCSLQRRDLFVKVGSSRHAQNIRSKLCQFEKPWQEMLINCVWADCRNFVFQIGIILQVNCFYSDGISVDTSEALTANGWLETLWSVSSSSKTRSRCSNSGNNVKISLCVDSCQHSLLSDKENEQGQHLTVVQGS